MKTILYVDDEELNLLLFKQNFKRNFKVLLADSGETGLDVFESDNSIEAVVSDMKMPGINGVQFLNKVKELNPSVPCFLLTGYDITDEIHMALKSNTILTYFQKPMNVRKITKTIEDSVSS